MIQDKNRQNSSQADQNPNEPVSNETGSQYRPDWIIPDNGISSKNSNTSNTRQDNQQDSSSIPMDNDETLGIP